MLAEEQAALRRVATLVARGAAPEDVFAAVAEEAGQMLPVDSACMCRYEPDRTLTFVAQWDNVVTRFRDRQPVAYWGAQSRHAGIRDRPSGPAGRLCR